MAQASIPPHLRCFVVEQDYAQYSEIDHAVWRFVLLQTHARLQHTAHAAYCTGLTATGIDIERIPRIDAMNDKLAKFGWSAVCVDGFIPPRAFQAFQANRILPIAAEIRSKEHLAYTPAPDIIHEAAGHAPILSDPAYASYLEAIGSISEKAFTVKADRDVYAAFHTLADIKESPNSTKEQVARAERMLQAALAQVSEVSESARLARLYWWTAEYGLVGTPDDYRLYGAGLLSSLGESHSCHDPAVRKIPLSTQCLEIDYDITQPQPQLFVARDFAELHEVLEQASHTLAYRTPGPRALHTAVLSEELATLGLDPNLEVVGILRAFETLDEQPYLLHVSGSPQLCRRGVPIADVPRPHDLVVPLGNLRDGRELGALEHSHLAAYCTGDQLLFSLDSGVQIRGVLRDVRVSEGRLELLLLEDFELKRPTGHTFLARALYPLALGTHVTRVHAGAPETCFLPQEPAHVRVPHPRWFSREETDLLALYERAAADFRVLGGEALVSAFEGIHTALSRNYPDEWLLRWNLLESLAKIGEGKSQTEQLTRELEMLEIRFLHREPITTGLAFIRSLLGG